VRAHCRRLSLKPPIWKLLGAGAASSPGACTGSSPPGTEPASQDATATEASKPKDFCTVFLAQRTLKKEARITWTFSGLTRHAHISGGRWFKGDLTHNMA